MQQRSWTMQGMFRVLLCFIWYCSAALSISRSSVSLDVEITYHHSQTQLFLKYNPYYYFKTSKLNLSSIDASRSNAKANRFPRQHHHP